MKIVIAGGSGFLGGAVKAEFERAGYEVVVLSRSAGGPGQVQWDGETVGPWAAELEGARAVINLSGKLVAVRWTESNKRAIVDSRVKTTQAIGKAIAQCKTPPEAWVNASAIGYYGETGDREADETSPPGTGFIAELCQNWEAAVEESLTPKTRKARVRIGVVIGKGSGVLAPLINLTRLFLGGQVGSGRQWFSWIDVRDLCAMFRWCVETDFEGAINAVAPKAVTNAQLMKELRIALHRPWSPPAPAFMVKAVLSVIGIPPELALGSTRVVPKVAMERGFAFQHAELVESLRESL